MIKVLALTKYGQLGASSRLRFLQYVPDLESRGFSILVQPLISDAMLRRRYEDNGYGRASLARVYAERISLFLRSVDIDVLWIEKELLPWTPFWVERFLIGNMPYVLDYDDAVFHAYDENRSSLVRRVFGRKLDKLMAGSDLVIAGNDYLEDRALRAGAMHVEQVPTVVDMNRYEVRHVQRGRRGPVVIGWIGSPSTARYLKQVELALSAVRQRHEIRCIAIGLMDRHVRGSSFEAVPWTEDSEAELLRGLDVGIMPLEDSNWERGKCGYKLIQYMACGLPVVASAIGANRAIVRDGVTGYLVNNDAAWVESLYRLVADPRLRERMGQAGRNRAEDCYSLRSQQPRLAELMQSVVDR